MSYYRIMKAAMYYDRGDIRIEDVDSNSMGQSDVLIQVDSTGICGSDLHEYAAGPIFAPGESPHPLSGETTPIRMGHEFSGVVKEIGNHVSHLEIEDKVAINPILCCGSCRQCIKGDYHICDSIGFIGLSGGSGGFAETVVLDAEHVVPLGDKIPIEYGAFVEPLSVGLHAVRRSNLHVGDTVAVFGSGPIGLAVIQCAKAAGASNVIVSEPRSARRQKAIECGADEIIDPSAVDAPGHIRSQTNGGCDISFEVAGVEASFKDAIASTAPGGHTTIVSIWEEEVRSQLNNLVLGERTVTGSLAYLGGPRAQEEYGMVIKMMEDGVLDPEPFITDRIKLDDIVKQGFEKLLDPKSEHVKILVKPN